MNQIGRVASIAASVWHSELADTLGISRRRVTVGTTVAAIAILGLGAGLGVATVTSLDSTMPVDVSRMMVQTAASGALLSATLISLIVTLIAPARSSLDNLICMLPVTNSARLIGPAIPTTLVAFTAGIAMSMPAILVAVRVLTSMAAATVFVGILLLGVILVQILLQAILHVLQSVLTSIFRLPSPIAMTFSGTITLALSLAAFGRQLLSLPRLANSGNPSVELPGIISDLAVGRVPLMNSIMFIAWVGGAFLITLLAGRVRNHKRSAPGKVAFPCDALVRGSKGVLVTQVLIIIRAPQTALALMGGLALLAAVASVPAGNLPAELRIGLAASLPSAGCALVLFGPGRILPWTWVGAATKSERSWWVVPLGMAHVSLAVLVWVALTSIELALGVLEAGDTPSMLERSLLLLGAAALAGMLVPWSETQQLSGSVGLVLAMGLYLATSSLSAQIALISTEAVGMTLTLLFAGVLTGFAVLTAHRLTRTR